MVRTMRMPFLLAILAVSLLAGCASGPPASPLEEGEEEANQLPLEATAATGVIRGIVVDTGVRPLANVLVTATSGSSVQRTNTTANGAFGFDGLAPGTYFVKASKPGFRDGQTTAEVAAGVDDPPLTRLALEPNAATRPHVIPVKSVGYIECGATAVFYSVAVCSVPNDLPGCGAADACTVTQDVFLFVILSEQVPSWAQSEMLWDSTQALGDAFSLVYSFECGDRNGGLLCDAAVARGASPLLLTANQTVMADAIDNGTGRDYMIRVFSSDVEETSPPPGTTQDVCVDTLVLGKPCARRGVGVTFQQRFEVFTHLFYGYVPPEWRFSGGQPAPEPPA